MPATATVPARHTGAIPSPQHVRSVVQLSLIFVPVTGLLAIAQLFADRRGYPMSLLTRDTSWALDGPFFAGWISNAGAVAWFAAATICFFTFALLRVTADREWGAFLLGSALLTLLLAVDDLFMLHDGLFPRVLGIGDRPTFAAYGVLTLLWLWTFRDTIRRTEYLPLGIALALFAGSLLVDRRFVALPPHRIHVFEDGAKLLGAIAWCFYLTSTSFRCIKRKLSAPV